MFQDFINVNKSALKSTMKNLRFLPILALVIVLLNVVLHFVLRILVVPNSAMNFLLGFIRYIVQVAFASALISVLDDLIKYNRFSWDNFSQGFTSYLSPLMNTFFYLYIIEFLVRLVTDAIPILGISFIATIILLAIESTLYEQTYIANLSGMEAISASVNFIINNIIYWIIPAILFIIVRINLDRTLMVIGFNPYKIINLIVLSLAMAFIYLYKGHLFNILHNSSRRKREFEGKFN